LQSYYLFAAKFARPAKGNDTGKVEGLVGYARRNCRLHETAVGGVRMSTDVSATSTEAHTADTPQLLLEHHLKELRLTHHPALVRQDGAACAVERVDYQLVTHCEMRKSISTPKPFRCAAKCAIPSAPKCVD